MTKDEALKLALEALQWNWGGEPLPTLELQAINAIKEALAQQSNEQVEPVAVTAEMARAFHRAISDGPLGQADEFEIQTGLEAAFAHITTPPQRTWVGLTDEEKHQLNNALNLQGRFPIIDAIEAKLRGKNS